jgi:dihydrofolate reductase
LTKNVERGIYVSWSGTLVALLADGLADELHLFVCLVVLGSGTRLFAEAPAPPPRSSRSRDI